MTQIFLFTLIFKNDKYSIQIIFAIYAIQFYNLQILQFDYKILFYIS